MSKIDPKTISNRARVRRGFEKARYDEETLYGVLDSHVLAHLAYVVDGQPFATPTLYWRDSDKLYWHGSAASRMLKAQVGEPVCLTVSHMDGIVLARSGLHSSVNYRSAMVYGTPERLTDEAEIDRQFDIMFNRFSEGRWETLRPAHEQELKATWTLVMDIEEASVKIRTGGCKDDEGDESWPVWAGVIPVTTVIGEPISEPDMPEDATPLSPAKKPFVL